MRVYHKFWIILLCVLTFILVCFSEMSDDSSKDSTNDGSKRFEEELAEQRPFYFVFINVLLKICFFLYDVLMFLPFKLFADPQEKRELSDRVKVIKFIVCKQSILIN
jgi:hypothetical protein